MLEKVFSTPDRTTIFFNKMQPCIFSKHIAPISDLEKLGLMWFMCKTEGTWVHSGFDVTNYIPHISTKNQ